MNPVADAHHLAMDTAQIAGNEYRTGNKALGHPLFQIALQHELNAIVAIPTRARQLSASVLHRSCAWLALNAGQPRLAKEPAERVLKVNPDGIFANELEEVLAVAEQALANPDQPLLNEGYYPCPVEETGFQSRPNLTELP